MHDSPRRGFLKATGVGLAAAGAAVAAPKAFSAASASSAPRALPSTAAGGLVAYVSDVHGGELSVMVEGREVVITDHDLVSRLAHAIHTSGRTTA